MVDVIDVDETLDGFESFEVGEFDVGLTADITRAVMPAPMGGGDHISWSLTVSGDAEDLSAHLGEVLQTMVDAAVGWEQKVWAKEQGHVPFDTQDVPHE